MLGPAPRHLSRDMAGVGKTVPPWTRAARRPIILTLAVAALLVSVWGTPSLVLGQAEPSLVLAAGQLLYEQHCQRCHGATGHGDGPAAKELTVAPADFHRFRTQIKTDEELRTIIEFGIAYSPMHAWHGQLRDEDFQHLIEYLRYLGTRPR